jgi:hypothetical protein
MGDGAPISHRNSSLGFAAKVAPRKLGSTAFHAPKLFRLGSPLEVANTTRRAFEFGRSRTGRQKPYSATHSAASSRWRKSVTLTLIDVVVFVFTRFINGAIIPITD